MTITCPKSPRSPTATPRRATVSPNHSPHSHQRTLSRLSPFKSSLSFPRARAYKISYRRPRWPKQTRTQRIAELGAQRVQGFAARWRRWFTSACGAAAATWLDGTSRSLNGRTGETAVPLPPPPRRAICGDWLRCGEATGRRKMVLEHDSLFGVIGLPTIAYRPIASFVSRTQLLRSSSPSQGIPFFSTCWRHHRLSESRSQILNHTQIPQNIRISRYWALEVKALYLYAAGLQYAEVMFSSKLFVTIGNPSRDFDKTDVRTFFFLSFFNYVNSIEKMRKVT